MFKLSSFIVCIAIIGYVVCEGQLKSEIVAERADEIAKWAGSKLGDYGGVKGELYVQSVNKVKSTQEDNKFKFELEVSYGVTGSKVAAVNILNLVLT